METQQNIPFRYNKRDYTFRKVADLKSSYHQTKFVFSGYFVGEAPDNLLPGKSYCMKIIYAVDPSETPDYIYRDCYDLLDFKGNHLRKLLCYDDSAKEIRNHLKNGTKWAVPQTCITIEDLGRSTDVIFQNCNQRSVAERLGFILDYANGLQELMQMDNAICGSPVLCARDTKSGNGVLFQLPSGEWIIRLIDFASIRLKKDKKRDENNGQKDNKANDSSFTCRTPASRMNTCPEHVTHKMPYSEKMDVYALGMMLSSLFLRRIYSEDRIAYVNPLQTWIDANGLWPDKEKDCPHTEADYRPIRERFKACQELDIADKNNETWMEKDLHANTKGVSLQWEDSHFINEIRKIVKDSTRLNPDKRLNLTEFIARIVTLLLKIKDFEAGRTTEDPAMVDIYIFHQANLDLHRSLYKKAATELFKKRSAEHPTLRALCISYNNNVIDDQFSRSISVGNSLVADNEEEMAGIIQDFPSASKNNNQDLLAYTICHVFREWFVNKQSSLFPTGKIFLFTEKVPSGDNICHLITRDHEDQGDICSVLNNVVTPICRRNKELYAYYILNPSGDDFYEKEFHIKSEYIEDSSNSNYKNFTNVEGMFYVGDDIPMVKTKDGKLFYAGFVKFK